MECLSEIKARLRVFRAETDASVSVEFILVMPMLFWAFMASYVFFDGYRQSSINLKAAYTIGDLISRETDPINDNYLDSMYSLHRLLTHATSSTTLRVTVVRWNEDDNRFYRDWSESRGDIMPLTSAEVLLLNDKLPAMPNAERVILVETTNSFFPVYKVGLETLSLDNFVFTRPRFAPQVVWES
ncbi:MAG: hypothetical protein ACI9BH_002099 [Paracoccaceae bacterium]|jgi:hypothetical protein